MYLTIIIINVYVEEEKALILKFSSISILTQIHTH